MAFNNQIVKIKPPARGKKQYLEVLKFFKSLIPAEPTNLNGSLKEYATICKNPGIAIIISDFFDPRGYEDGLKALAYRNFDINLIHVMDHEERYWSKTGNLLLNDCETGEKKASFVDKNLLELYHTKINEFIAGIKNYCSHYGMNYFLCDTHIPFEKSFNGLSVGRRVVSVTRIELRLRKQWPRPVVCNFERGLRCKVYGLR